MYCPLYNKLRSILVYVNTREEKGYYALKCRFHLVWRKLLIFAYALLPHTERSCTYFAVLEQKPQHLNFNFFSLVCFGVSTEECLVNLCSVLIYFETIIFSLKWFGTPIKFSLVISGGYLHFIEVIMYVFVMKQRK